MSMSMRVSIREYEEKEKDGSHSCSASRGTSSRSNRVAHGLAYSPPLRTSPLRVHRQAPLAFASPPAPSLPLPLPPFPSSTPSLRSCSPTLPLSFPPLRYSRTVRSGRQRQVGERDRAQQTEIAGLEAELLQGGGETVDVLSELAWRRTERDTPRSSQKRIKR